MDKETFKVLNETNNKALVIMNEKYPDMKLLALENYFIRKIRIYEQYIKELEKSNNHSQLSA